MDDFVTWLNGYLADHSIRTLRPRADHLVWQIERENEEDAPVFLEIPEAYLRSESLESGDLARALEREDLVGRIERADRDSETGWRLTRETTGRMKELVLVDAEPPDRAERSVRQPPDAPGPVPR